jgi:hypothetical protein
MLGIIRPVFILVKEGRILHFVSGYRRIYSFFRIDVSCYFTTIQHPFDSGYLWSIPGVEKFELMKQIGKKNEFEFGLSMEFANQQAYDQYNNHPDHIAFVQNRWIMEVEEFLEIDFKLLN